MGKQLEFCRRFVQLKVWVLSLDWSVKCVAVDVCSWKKSLGEQFLLNVTLIVYTEICLWDFNLVCIGQYGLYQIWNLNTEILFILLYMKVKEPCMPNHHTKKTCEGHGCKASSMRWMWMASLTFWLQYL